MTPKLRMGAFAAAFAVVAVLAVIGWTRKPEPSAAYHAGPSYAGVGYAPAAPNPVFEANADAPGPRQIVDPRAEPYREEAPDVRAVNPCVQSVQYGYATPSYASPIGVRTIRPRVIEEQPRVYAERRRVVTRRGRSTGKSAAIVAGSAGVGAAIGALAGGGKGAAIGALAGGGSGFVYDRITHNR